MSASTNDFSAPFDPTAYSSITGAQLLQLVTAATPYTDKGLIVVTLDVNGIPAIPDATTTTKWQKYLWLRIIPNSSSLTLYAWNPNGQNNIANSDIPSSGSTLTNWVSVISGSIPAGSVFGYQIANATIQPANINLAALAAALGFNSGTALTTASSPTGGIITGSFAGGLTIAAGTITDAMHAALTITGASIHAATIDYTKLIGNGNAGDMLKSTGTPNIAPVWFTPLQITTGLANPSGAGADDNKLVAVNSGAGGTFKYVTSPVSSLYYRQNYAGVTAAKTMLVATGDSATLNANTANLIPITSVNLATTTASAYHLLTIAGSCLVKAGLKAWIYVYNADATTATGPIAAIRMFNPSGSDMTMPFCLKARSQNGAVTTAITYYAVLGGGVGCSVSANGDTCSLTVEEVA